MVRIIEVVEGGDADNTEAIRREVLKDGANQV